MKLLKEMLDNGNDGQSQLLDNIKKLNRDLKNNKPPSVFVKWVELRDRVLNGRTLDELSTSDLNYLVKSGNKLNGGAYKRDTNKTWDM